MLSKVPSYFELSKDTHASPNGRTMGVFRELLGVKWPWDIESAFHCNVYTNLKWINASLCHTLHNMWSRHYIDVIVTTMASQITSLTVVYSTVYSGADQRKHQSSASLAFVGGIHRDRWFPRTKGQLRGKCFHLMTSSRANVWGYSLIRWNGCCIC